VSLRAGLDDAGKRKISCSCTICLEVMRKTTKFSVGLVVNYAHIRKRDLPKTAILTDELRCSAPPSSVERKNAWSFVSTPSVGPRLHDVMATHSSNIRVIFL
jgi:hypothetical protein